MSLVRQFEAAIGSAAALTALAGALTVATHSEEPVRSSTDLSRRPSVADALAQLPTLFTAARASVEAGDPAPYCALIRGPVLCEDEWHGLGGTAAVPTRPPHLLGMREDLGSRVLVLCGRDGLGRPYRMELPVFTYRDGGVHPIAGPFWQTQRFHGTFTESKPFPVPPPAPELSLPPECG